MSTVIRIPVAHDPPRLAQELAALGYVVAKTVAKDPTPVGHITNGALYLDADVDPSVFAALFAAHVPTPLPPPAVVAVERTVLEAIVGQMHTDGSEADHANRDAAAGELKRYL